MVFGIIAMIKSFFTCFRPFYCRDVNYLSAEEGGYGGYPNISEVWWVPDTDYPDAHPPVYNPFVGRWTDGSYAGQWFLGYVNTGNVHRTDRFKTLDGLEKGIDRDESPYKMVNDEHREIAHHIVECIRCQIEEA